MSIIAVHGPVTWGTAGVVVQGPVSATATNPANGLVWTFALPYPTTRVAADFDWTYSPAGGVPATPVADTPPPLTITFTGAGAKTVSLVVSGAGAGANPYPPAGTYQITVNAVAGAAPRDVEGRSAGPDMSQPALKPEAIPDDEVYDPADFTVEEVIAWAEEDPDQLDAIIAAEEAGKARVTLLARLNDMKG